MESKYKDEIVVNAAKYSQYVVECSLNFFWFNTIQLIFVAIYLAITLYRHRSRLGNGNILLCISSGALFLGREIVFIIFQ